MKNDFENENFAIFKAKFKIGRQSAKDLLKQESPVFHSINLGFDAEVAEKLLKWYLVYMD